MMALVALRPIGAVPALPTALAIAVTLIAGQVVLGRNLLWLPVVILAAFFALGGAGAVLFWVL